ncbi:hypothetical protein [Thermococcus thioreducens]|uniref:Uncharacterized protein n=2 Tax=Thermococcus thioreducens TaxID=277988 RepID=A0A1I0PH99_9EURY|nr:hypothetical protein SAMN05216170_1823 [Thermococcus thioreducens]
MGMEDILIPKERRDAVVLIGVDRGENVEFIKVYAVSEEKAEETLEAFLNAKGLFPADYRLVGRGSEEVGDRKAITTKSEEKLSSSLARLGLRLLSNGVLYLDGIERVYQLTLVSEKLYAKLRRMRESQGVKKRGGSLSISSALSLGLHTLIVNWRGINVEPLVPEDATLLREPSPAEVLEAMKTSPQVVVETVFPEKYFAVPFGVRIKIPPLSKEEFARELEDRIGVQVDENMLDDYPAELLNYRSIESIAHIVEELLKMGVDKEKALETAIFVNLGFVPSDFRLED